MLGTSVILISIATAVAVIFVSFFNLLRERANAAVLMKHVEAGHPLSDELVKSLQGAPRQSAMPDVRKAILLIALGIAGAIFSQFLSSHEDINIAQGMSVFPVLLGLGYLVSMKIEKSLR